jgi:histidine triad (HIT) family protein
MINEINKDCLFCKIANKEIKADVVYENDKIIAFRDIHPIAPVHVLIIPKEHIGSMNSVTEERTDILGEMLYKATRIAKELEIAEGGYKLLIRTGKNGGQEVPHVHLHLLGGARLSEDIHPIS